jgi:hypothetical protein
MYSPCGASRDTNPASMDIGPCSDCGASMWSSLPPGVEGLATIAFPVMPDFTPAKLAEADRMAEQLAVLPITDVLRILAAAGHELFHRRPDVRPEDVAAEIVTGITELHLAGLA